MLMRRVLMAMAGTLLVFWLTGCVERGLPALPGDSGYSHGWSSAEEKENIDISDLDKNLTESETVITEENAKVARIPFPVEEYARLPKMGKGTIKGQIYLTDGYDRKVFGRGTRLYLNPKTSYSDQWYEESYIGGHKMQKADNRLFNYLRFTSSYQNGNFAFYGVPSGSYYLIGTVTCGTECGYDRPTQRRIATLVTVKGNQIVQKDLSGQMY